MTWERLAVATVSPSIGQLSPIGVARGAYTEITEIVAPSSARAGDWVDVTIKIKNISTATVGVWTLGLYNSVERFVDFEDWIPAGSTREYMGTFIMPDRDVTIHAYTYYLTEDGYRFDDEAEKRVSLAAPPEVYAGTIIGIELEHDGIQEGLPVYNIPQGQTARVHVWGRNDMATVQRLGIHWIVRDPDGEVVEDYEDWSTLGYRQGADHKFSGGYFNLAKEGTYTVNIALSMNPADPEIVDDYYGTLCTVAAVAPPPEVWVKLATKAITLTPEVVPPPEVWEKLAERQVTITPEVVELVWEKLAERQITITPEVALIWEKLAEKRVTITPEVLEWLKLASKTITVTPEVEIPPEYVLIQETIYPWAYTFEGDAEVCTFEFKLTPEQIPVYPWLGQRIVDSFVSELEKEGSRLLELRVYEDTTPTFWTNYRVEVTASASPIVWTPIIIGVLAILFLVAIIFTIRAIDEVFFKRKGLDEETKKTFARETLIAMILDLAPETPGETLEGMADQELRDLLNEILVKVAPPISPWAIAALVGGLGVLGVGAAFALSAAKPGGTSLKERGGHHSSTPTWPRSTIPEPYQTMVRRELRKIPTWKIQEAYGKLKAGEATGIELVERNRAYALSAIEEILWERGKLR